MEGKWENDGRTPTLVFIGSPLWHWFRYQWESLVPVPDSTGGSGTGAKLSSGRVLVLTARNPEYAS